MDQGALTLISQVGDGRVEDLRALLRSIGDDVMKNELVPFPRLTRVHFARWVMLEDLRHGVELAFESNYDGDEDAHLDELVHEAAAGLDTIYQHCVGYPEPHLRSHASRKDFLRTQKRAYAALHMGHPGLSARRIVVDREIRHAVQGLLDAEQRAGRLRGLGPVAIRDRLRDLLREEHPDLDLSSGEPRVVTQQNTKILAWLLGLTLAALLLSLFIPPKAAVVVAALLAVAALVAAYKATRSWFEQFEQREQAEQERGPRPPRPPKVYPLPDSPAARAIRMRENRFSQNPLTHLVDVKSGFVRLWVLKVVLTLVEFLARVWYVEGQLGNITTIHFGRWILLEDRRAERASRRLLFFSNYDGSWESYLGDFIDKQAPWLTAVWTNTVRFPPTKLLFGHGAAHEEDFKRWTLDHQVPTLCWYSAYPELSVRNVLDNALVREGLLREGDDREIATWLRLL